MIAPEMHSEKGAGTSEEWIYSDSRFALRRTGREVWAEVQRLPLAPLDILGALQIMAPEARPVMDEVFRAVVSPGTYRVALWGEGEGDPAPRVVVEEAGMICRLHLSPGAFSSLEPQDGAAPRSPREELLTLLDREGVVYGVDGDALEQALARSAAGEAVCAVVARGLPPVPGEDGRLELFFSPPTGRPVESEGGGVDHYHLDLIVPVGEGAVVARRYAPTPGKAGRTVRGEEVPPREGRVALLNFGPGLSLSENGELVTKFSGALFWKGSKILLERLLVIPGDVDYATGNIAYDGPVLVRGSVRGGFAVEAQGDVDILGSVEDATVTSRTGKVSVRFGIQGKGRAAVRAGSDVLARFIQEAVVECETLMVNEYILRSTVSARKGVLVEGGKGVISASEIRALGHVHAWDVRSFREGDTSIDIPGVSRKDLFKEYQALEGEIEAMRDQLSALAAEVRAVGRGSPRLRDLLQRYVNQADLMAEWEQRFSELGEFLRKLRGDATFALRGACSQGVRLRLRGQPHVIRNAVSHITLFYDSNEDRVITVASGGA